MSRPFISIVIPTRHEATTIGAFLNRVARALADHVFEIVVVDDSDRDNTMEVLERAQAELGRRRLVVVHRPRGSVVERTLGTAVVTGIRRARGTYVCVMDGDGQHPPEVVPRMLATAQRTNADYVGASRYLHGGSAEGLGGVKRKLISLGLAWLARTALAFTPILGITDPLSGFFLVRRSLVRGVELKPVGWKISLEVLVRTHARRLTEVPYTFAARDDGDSKATLQQGLLVLRHIVVLVLSLQGPRRVLLFGLVGLTGALINTGTLLVVDRLGFD